MSNLKDKIKLSLLPFVKLCDRSDLPEIRACYFVLQNEEVLYIGRTINLRKRWIGHHLLRNYTLPSSIKIAWLAAKPNWSLEKMEKDLIIAFKPKINRPYKLENAVRLTLDISESLHKAIKRKATDQGIAMADMLRELLEKYYS